MRKIKNSYLDDLHRGSTGEVIRLYRRIQELEELPLSKDITEATRRLEDLQRE